MRILDNEQRGVIGGGLLHNKHFDHIHQLADGTELQVVTELGQNDLQQRCRIQACAINNRNRRILCQRLDEVLDNGRFAREGRALKEAKTVVICVNIAQELTGGLLRGGRDKDLLRPGQHLPRT